MEPENIEQEILLQPEVLQVGKVNSVNGMTGDVVLTTSDLENTSDYQTGSDVTSAISTHNSDEEAHPYIQGQFAGKQDKLTAGTNIQISEQNVISATDTTYSAGNGINISGSNAISVDTTIVATQQNLSDEVTNRENADIYLQQQIDGISASSDVVDIVGTYAELQAYDTQHLKDNDIIKVLQDETQGGATTYYRWSTSTNTFTLIGQEGPYYTKASADAQFVPQTRTVNSKSLSANITLTASDVSALGTSDVVQTTGSSTSQVMSQNAVTQQLGTKLNISDYVVDDHLANSTNPVENQVLFGLLGNMPSGFFSGSATTSDSGTEVQFNNILELDDMQLNGDTFQQTYSGANLYDYTDTYLVNPDITVGSDGWITATYDNSAGPSTVYVQYYTNPVALTADTNYNVVLEVETVTGTGYLVPVTGNVASQFTADWLVSFDNLSNNTVYTHTSKTKADLSSSTISLRSLITFNAGQSGSIKFRLSLLADTSVTPQTFVYQPFVGGTASPNPDYPQDVQVVTGEQTVTVTGKNLFDVNGIVNLAPSITIAQNSNYRGYYIKATAGDTYTLSRASTDAPQRFRVVFTKVEPANGVDFWDVNGYPASIPNTDNQTVITFTVPNEMNYIFIYLANNGSTITESEKIQLEQGQPTTYEPYQSTTKTVDLGSIELCKIGDYQDYIYKSGEDWYVHKATLKRALGGLTWVSSGASASGVYRMATTDLSSTILYPSSDTQVFQGLCTHYTPRTASGTYYGGLGISVGNNGYVQVYDPDYNTSTSASSFKTWLDNNSVTLYAVLATPTDTKITDSTLIGQLEAVLDVQCYSQTNISVEATSASDLPAILDLVAVNANAQGLIYKVRGS